jgi:hypothetical protein
MGRSRGGRCRPALAIVPREPAGELTEHRSKRTIADAQTPWHDAARQSGNDREALEPNETRAAGKKASRDSNAPALR